MAENRGLKRVRKVEAEHLETEERRSAKPKFRVVERGDFEIQKKDDIQMLDHLMFEYEVMPDSFIMPEMYDGAIADSGERVYLELEKAKRNKLITGWFAKIFQALETICRQYDFNQSEINKLNSEFKQLIGEEDEAAMALIHESLGGKRLEQISPEELPRIIKEGKKGVAVDFMARKLAIIREIEELANELKQKLLALEK